MKGIIIGLGSMGKRRARLLQQQYPALRLFGVDASEKRCHEAEQTFSFNCYGNLAQAIAAQHPEVAFVCTSPESHCSIIEELLKNDVHVFTEINLIDRGYQRLMELAEQKGKFVFISSTPMYRHEVKRIGELVSAHPLPLMYRYHIGQYLPDWHPWENIKDYFVSNPETNGCREIFAIQLPWILKTFGALSKKPVQVLRRKISDLPVPFPDSYIALFEHESGHLGVLAVDVVARKPVNNLEIVGEHLQIRWDGTTEGFLVYDFETKRFEQETLYDRYEQNANYASNIIEDAYAEELKCFFQAIEGCVQPLHSLAADTEVLRIIDEIEH